MDYTEAKEYLDSFINFELNVTPIPRTRLKLKRVVKLCEALGHPDKGMRIIHIAGSKGKGSTSVMTAHILKEAGFRVGLFTSPHLMEYSERIRVLDAHSVHEDSTGVFSDAITNDELAELVARLKPTIERCRKENDKALGKLTFFEIWVMLAICYFKNRDVDFVVLETGLGGKLDATNIFQSEVAAITSISLEHTTVLGNSLTKIAGEKAGIIKNKKQKVIVANQGQKVLDVVRARSSKYGITPKVVRKLYKKYQVPLRGEHQKMNAATAVAIVKSLGLKQNLYNVIRKGLRNTYWPGRFEIRNYDSKIIFDCAHNEDSIKLLLKTFRQEFPRKKPVVVFGASLDKQINCMIKVLESFTSEIIFTQSNHRRAKQFKPTEVNGEIAENIEEALDKAFAKKKIVLVTGSVFLVAEARRSLENRYVSV